MVSLKGVVNALKNIGSLFRLQKKKRKVPSGAMSRGAVPAFTSMSANQEPKRLSMAARIKSWFQRSARRKDLNRSPVVVARSTPKRLILVLSVVIVVLSLAFLAYGPIVRAVADIKFFKIREISITGCRVTTPALLRELAGVRYQASLLALSPDHIEAILRMHPWIAKAEVKRDWPDVLIVTIQEYAPEALVVREVSGGSQFFYLDKSGVVFAPVEPGGELDFPVVTGLTGKEDAETLRKATTEALALLKLVRQNNPNLPLQNLSEMHVDQDAGMTIYLADYPFPIYFGKGEIRTKYSRLKRVLEVLYKEAGQGMTIADVAYIRMDYLENKVLVAHSGSG
ncbi:MAG: cell division septal [Desulfobulbaceae bacterium]|jgi:cell division protein FtsQ|nr:MAG: cell division septal [Desulfobulbaceae bacterium]